MIFLPILLFIWTLLCLGDALLYKRVVFKHGSQMKLWLGSGYYLTWKYRNRANQERSTNNEEPLP